MSTTPLGFEKPDPGASDDEWGYALNRNFDRLDAQLQDKAARAAVFDAEAAAEAARDEAEAARDAAIAARDQIVATNEIGTAGAMGFGVGGCPALPLGCTPLGGNDRTDQSYGNYRYQDGSILVWVPAFYYRIGSAL